MTYRSGPAAAAARLDATRGMARACLRCSTVSDEARPRDLSQRRFGFRADGGEGARRGRLTAAQLTMVIDYSKWDKLEVSSSSDDEDGAPIPSSAPRVHRLDRDAGEELQVGNIRVRSSAPPSGGDRGSAKASTSDADGARSVGGGARAGTVDAASLSHNGASFPSYRWSQSSDHCVLSVLVPAGSRAADVEVVVGDRGMHHGAPCAKCVHVNHTPSGVAIGGALAYPCRAEEDDLIAHWELKDVDEGASAGGSRAIQVTLRKLSPAPNITVWWKRLFESETSEVDVSSFRERRNPGSFAEAFRQAEEQFKRNIRQQQGDLDVGSEG